MFPHLPTNGVCWSEADASSLAGLTHIGDPESVIHAPLAGSRFLPFIQLQSLAHVGWLLAADVRLPDVESGRFEHLWHDSQLHPPKPLSPTVAN